MKDKLIEEDMDVLQHVGMMWLLHDPLIQVEKELLTSLMERWYEKTNTFHLPIGEIIVVPEDIQ